MLVGNDFLHRFLLALARIEQYLIGPFNPIRLAIDLLTSTGTPPQLRVLTSESPGHLPSKHHYQQASPTEYPPNYIRKNRASPTTKILGGLGGART